MRSIYDRSMYHLLATFCLSVVSLLFVNEVLEFYLSSWLILGLTLAVCTVFLIAHILSKRRIVLGVFYTAMFCILLFLQLYGYPIVTYIRDAIQWVFHVRDMTQTSAYIHAWILICGFLLLISLLFYIMTEIEQLRFYLAIALLATILLFSTKQVLVPRTIVLLVLLYLGAVFFERFIKREQHKELNLRATAIPAQSVTHILPVILVCSFVLILLPTSAERLPIERFIHDTADFFIRSTRNMEDILPWGNNRDFRVNMTGYARQLFLGGRLEATEQDALKVQSTSRERNIYLAGSYFDYFTGQGWENIRVTPQFGVKEHTLRLVEFLLALDNHEVLTHLYEEEIRQIVEVRQHRITFQDLRTRSLFHPPLITAIWARDDFDDLESNIIFQRTRTQDTIYQLNYLAVNYDHDRITAMLRSSYHPIHFDIQRLQSMIRQIPGRDIIIPELSEDMIEILQLRREFIFQYYTVLPEDSSPRLNELAQVITEGFHSPYEQMKAIVSYFHTQGYEYTSTPPPLPDVDFAVWFLTEAREGYCTYFATAAALLGRSLGIPVRMVQGFAHSREQGSDFVMMQHRHAHSWIEAYIDNVGWIAFEPTPGSGTPGSTFVRQEQRVTTESPELNRAEIDRIRHELEQEEQAILEEEQRVYQLVLSGFVMGFVVLCLTIGLVLCILFLRSKARYQTANHRTLYMIEFHTLFFLFELLGMPIRSGETIREYYNRWPSMEHRLSEFTLDLKPIFMVHERIVYQQQEVKEGYIDQLISLRKVITKRLKTRKEMFRYYRYLLER